MMLIRPKNVLQILFCIVLATQLGGCIFVDRDRWHHDRDDWHRDHGDWHHDHGDHAVIDVNVH